ncbi:MAG: two component transcriptional regulator, winged helix family [Fibrobacteres bacterium]|nr:two component transcriptional regulator, winged helix family [Fibrobacterota bacterium]
MAYLSRNGGGSAVKTVLILDDDRKLGKLLTDYLAKFGFKGVPVFHPDEAIRFLRREVPDVVILDVMLPGKDGFEMCREIRRDYTVPIIMLTARGEVADRVLGLELGADDYLPKPFEPRELVARIQSVLRRGSGSVAPDKLRHGGLELDFRRREANLGGKSVDLTAMEFEVLALFARSPGKVMDRDYILDRTKGMEWEPYNRSIDVLISRLRQKLGDDPRKPAFLKTVRGAGYMYIGDEDEAEGQGAGMEGQGDTHAS